MSLFSDLVFWIYPFKLSETQSLGLVGSLGRKMFRDAEPGLDVLISFVIVIQVSAAENEMPLI